MNAFTDSMTTANNRNFVQPERIPILRGCAEGEGFKSNNKRNNQFGGSGRSKSRRSMVGLEDAFQCRSHRSERRNAKTISIVFGHPEYIEYNEHEHD